MANKPQKQERKRQRLLARAHKLEIQAKKFLADSKKAKLLYEQLTKAKEVRVKSHGNSRLLANEKIRRLKLPNLRMEQLR